MVSKLLDRQYGLVTLVPGNEVFGLQFRAAAGGGADAEVGQPFVPGSGDAQLFGATFSRVPGQRMQFCVASVAPNNSGSKCGALSVESGVSPTPG